VAGDAKFPRLLEAARDLRPPMAHHHRVGAPVLHLVSDTQYFTECFFFSPGFDVQCFRAISARFFPRCTGAVVESGQQNRTLELSSPNGCLLTNSILSHSVVCQ